MCKLIQGWDVYIRVRTYMREDYQRPIHSSLAATFFFFTLVTGPRRSLGLKLSDTRVYEPQMRACLDTTAHFCKVVVLLS